MDLSALKPWHRQLLAAFAHPDLPLPLPGWETLRPHLPVHAHTWDLSAMGQRLVAVGVVVRLVRGGYTLAPSLGTRLADRKRQVRDMLNGDTDGA